jgi:hypothetical protein
MPNAKTDARFDTKLQPETNAGMVNTELQYHIIIVRMIVE